MTTGRSRTLVIVHGHREGNAPGGRREISRECLARVRAAERAARRHEADVVLFCGAGAPGHPSEARQMADEWQGPEIEVRLDERSEDTAQNAVEALAWARALRATRLIVVSSWWHLRLLLYYRGRRFGHLEVRYARTRRLHRIVRHLWHELRYAPAALRALER